MTLTTISTPALWAGRVISGLAIIFLLFDGVMKLIPLDVVVETSQKMGIPTNLIFIISFRKQTFLSLKAQSRSFLKR